MKLLIVNFLARVLPDYCVFDKWFGVFLCKYNPWYEDVMIRKAQLKGYK